MLSLTAGPLAQLQGASIIHAQSHAVCLVPVLDMRLHVTCGLLPWLAIGFSVPCHKDFNLPPRDCNN
jgi:hypothetical protein